MTPIRVVVWNEFVQERRDKPVIKQYPKGIHEQIAAHLRQQQDLSVSTATLDQPDHGLTQDVLEQTDVIIMWSHGKNNEFEDRIVDRIEARVKQGMGMVFLHSAHMSKIFKRLMGKTGDHPWRNKGELERLWVIKPEHPLVQGVPASFELKQEEMYGEPFDIATPEDIIILSGWKTGEIFRSGLTWKKEKGKLVYFRPGHESYPTFHDPIVLRIILNAVRWAAN